MRRLSVGLAEDDFRSVSNRSCDRGFSEEVIGELEIDLFVILIIHSFWSYPVLPIERLDKGKVRFLFFQFRYIWYGSNLPLSSAYPALIQPLIEPNL
jgi:hypothetical protein